MKTPDDRIPWEGCHEIDDDDLNIPENPKPPFITVRNEIKESVASSAKKPIMDTSNNTINTNGSLWGSSLNQSVFRKNKEEVGVSVYMQHDDTMYFPDYSQEP